MRCLNCNSLVTANFCPNCGQKTSTKRFSFNHIFENGVLSGIFNVNRSLLYTLKELFTRPGHSIRDYIQGKRIKHINSFSLLVVLIAIEILIQKLFASDNEVLPEILEDSTDSFNQIMISYPQLIYIIVIVTMAVSTFVLFRKSKTNFAENILLNVYVMSGMITLSFPFTILNYWIQEDTFRTILDVYSIIAIVYVFWFIYQFFSKYKYRKITLVLFVLVSIVISQLLKFATLIGIIEIKKILEAFV
ncbi:Protein of unknown function [Hyunsoonleella jejuensis]|uniref:DUF3667 domain-containing protein n=1 Tax=Hyunsoonleella jejuensis TaxID=419940 RepID=A0A1H8ZRB6_9FLAO|nr:DUF3667 domain-containing protein [Hyunsoonleella jejuensis]SEP67059.1 Protein of unknown function [Hyunsoonleella jejuensis]